jgi:hypothetical protein
MGIAKYYDLKGVDYRTKNLARDPSYAGEMRNVRKDSNGHYRKRNGYTQKASIAGALAQIEANAGQDMIAVTPSELKKWNGASYDSVTFGGAALDTNYSQIPDWDEHNEVTYITDPSLNEPVFKYDGDQFYRAGCPPLVQSDLTGLSGTGTYFRIQYGVQDAKGNITYGNWTQVEASLSNFTLKTFSGLKYKWKYATDNSNSGTYTKADGLFNYNASAHNLQVGEWISIMAEKSLPGTRAVTLTPQPVRVNAISGAGPYTIQIDLSTMEDDATIRFSNPHSHLFSHFIRWFQSSSSTSNFTLFGVSAMANGPTNTLNWGDFSGIAEPTPMEDVVDLEVVLRELPYAKYVTVFQGTLVLGHIKPETYFQQNYKDSFFWSFLGVGGSPEAFRDSQRSSVGKTSELNITGFYANEDRLTVMKGRQVYDISGILTDFNFTQRSLNTNGIGCVAHRSIIEVEGGCFFMTKRGVFYHSPGSTPRPAEVSPLIETLFTELRTDLVLENTIGINDILREEILFFIPSSTIANSLVVVYSYKFKEWYVWDAVIGSGGIVYYNDKVWHQDSTDVFERDDSGLNDNGVAINAYWRSAFNDLEFPSLDKLFLNLILFSPKSIDWKAEIKTFLNWDDTNPVDTFTLKMANKAHALHELVNYEAKNIALQIGNNVLDEDIDLAGFELEYEVKQVEPGGE